MDLQGDLHRKECILWQPRERSTILFNQNVSYDSDFSALSNHVDTDLVLRPAASSSNAADEMEDIRNLSAHRDLKGNALPSLRTLKVLGRDGKVVAKLQLRARRAGPSSVIVGAQIFVKGSASLFVSMELLLSRARVPRTLFQELDERCQQRNLQWHDNKQRRKAQNKAGSLVQSVEKTELLESDFHQTVLGDIDKSELHKEINNKSKLITALENELTKVKQQLVHVSRELKMCHDQLLDMKGNIRVFCRCRPLSVDEVKAGYTSVIAFNMTHNNELCVHTSEGAKRSYKFDHVFTPLHSQEDVFLESAPLVVSVLDGFNVCIFAYGQTGTGKTYTMEGAEDNRGVNYRTLERLFELVSQRKGQYAYDISVSGLEIYNEEIRDLLAISPSQGGNSKRLEVKQVAERALDVPGVVEAQVHCIEDAWEVLQSSNKARVVGSTNANKQSSRSHCMLRVMITGENLLSGECTKSKLWLVDLAGSERIGKTDVRGDRLKEAQNINKSLSALGDVINALANRSSHIPYRNSKLTHLLQDSLGGQSKTLMFLQISPCEQDVGETLCSLNFASRVRGVELGVARRQVDPAELLRYKKLVEKAKQDGFLKDKIIKELQEASKVKEQTFNAVSLKVKEKEGLYEAEKKARLMVEEKLREQQVLIEKLKLTSERSSAEPRAKLSRFAPEHMGHPIPPAFTVSTPKRPPLHERLVDNREDSRGTIPRPKKRPTEGYLQKENTGDEHHDDFLPAKKPARRVSISVMQHPMNANAKPGAASYFPGLLSKRRAGEANEGDRQASSQMPYQKPVVWGSTIKSRVGNIKNSGAECMATRIPSRNKGRASLCVVPHSLSAPSSPLFKFAKPRRQSTAIGVAWPTSVGMHFKEEPQVSLPKQNVPAIAPDCDLRAPMAQGNSHDALFRSPNFRQPLDQLNPNAPGIGGEAVHGTAKARRVITMGMALGKPPQHPHALVYQELQSQSKRQISFAEDVDHHVNKARRVSNVSPSQLRQVWRPIMAPATPRHLDDNTNLNISGKANLAHGLSMMSSLGPQQLWPPLLPTPPPATPAASSVNVVLGGARRVPVSETKSIREGRNRRQWNR